MNLEQGGVVLLFSWCPCQSPDHPDRQWVRLGLPKDLRTPTQPAEPYPVRVGDSRPGPSHAKRILSPYTIPALSENLRSEVQVKKSQLDPGQVYDILTGYAESSSRHIYIYMTISDNTRSTNENIVSDADESSPHCPPHAPRLLGTNCFVCFATQTRHAPRRETKVKTSFWQGHL